MKKVVIFDIDGTLVDSTLMHAKAWKKAFQDFGYNFEIKELIAHIGRGGRGLITDFIGSEQYQRIGETLRAKHQVYFDQLGEAKPFPKVKELFIELRKRGKVILLASSASEETVAKHINLLSVVHLVDGKVSGSEVSEAKPAPDIFIAALKLVSADPKESIVVGDSIWDIQAAKKAGIESIAVQTGGISREILQKAGAKETYQDIADLYRNLDRSLLIK